MWRDGLPNTREIHVVSRTTEETSPEFILWTMCGQVTIVQGVKDLQWNRLSGGLQEH